MTENLMNGGTLIRVTGASGLAVENVPGAKRGMIVESAVSYIHGAETRRGRYRLTVPVGAGSDLWRVRREEPAIE